MKFKNYCLFFCIITLFLTACESGIKYPEKLPETANIQNSVYNGITTKTYSDKDGNIFRIAHFNEKNEPCTDPVYGAAETITLKDGDVLETTYYDSIKHPMINPNLGYARSRLLYNKENYILEEAYYDANNKLIIPTGLYVNYAMAKYEYDNNKQMTKMITYDEKKKVILPITTYDYDSNYQNTKTSYVDEKGNLLLNKSGYAYLEYKYNSQNMPTEYSYHDTKGNLVMIQEVTEEGDDEASTISHARGVWAYPEKGDTSSILSLYDANNKLIKEVVYNDYDEEGDEGFYRVVNDEAFNDAKRMNNVFTFTCKALLQLKPENNAFRILQNWNGFCYSKANDFYNSLRIWYDQKSWDKNEAGRKLTSDEAGARYDSIAWDMYYISDYFIMHPEKVKSAFEKVKPLVKQFVSKDLYTKSEASLLVTTALSAYDDIQKRGAQPTLQNIDKVMKISQNPDFYQTADLYKHMKEYIGMSLSDVNGKLSEEEKKEVIVWAYSFWLRRNNEQSTDTAYQLLKEINEMYQ